MRIHWIWYAQLPNISGREKQQLLERFSDPEEIYNLDLSSLARNGELPEKVAKALEQRDLAEAHKILETCHRKDIGVLCYTDSAYPRRLRNIDDAPMVLYYKGAIPDFEKQPVISIVGTRKATAYGLTSARTMAQQVAQCGALVASGCAGGIDTAAMQGVLDAGKPVVGVLGCGVDVVYPRGNRKLYMDTEREGCLLSEYPPGTKPYPWNFPRRNRILSGISNGVLVIEAPEDSGALITADFAMEQGRDVFVVPGNIGVAACAGSNALLRDYAAAVCCGWDVMQDYEPLYPNVVKCVRQVEMQALEVAQNAVFPEAAQPAQNKKSIDNLTSSPYSKTSELDLSPEEKAVFDSLTTEPMLIDDVIAGLDIPAGKVLATLTMLALRGAVQNHPGRRVSRKRN